MEKYAEAGLDRAGIDVLPGLLLLEFGIDNCPHCQRAQACIEAALRDHPDVRHIKVEDGPGRRLGRTFRVKHWPTVILMRDGKELGRSVRPSALVDVEQLLAT